MIVRLGRIGPNQGERPEIIRRSSPAAFAKRNEGLQFFPEMGRLFLLPHAISAITEHDHYEKPCRGFHR